MSICSLVVFTRPNKMADVRADIEGREGCEVAAGEDGKLIVLIDHPSRDVTSQAIMDLNNIPGVISVSLVYEYFEDGETADAVTEEA